MFRKSLLCLSLALSSSSVIADGYKIVPLVASDPSYAAPLIDPTLRGGWGIAIRPPGSLGGHFWLSSYGNGTSNQYVGDVHGVPLFQDALVNMDVPPFPPGQTPPVPSGPSTFVPDGEGVSQPTGQTWQQTPGFITTLVHTNGTITAPAKFLFATEDGVISTWTDNKQPNGTPNWVGYSAAQIDRSQQGSAFFGITVSLSSGWAYVADLGTNPGMRVFSGDYTERTDLFGAFNPFIGNDGFQAGEYLPFGIRTAGLTGAGNLFVTYQKTLVDPLDPLAIVPGLGDVGIGNGRLAEYSPDGSLVATWDDLGLLNSPYDIAIAPADFGLYSNTLIVANAGDGTLVAFDQTTRTAIDYLRNKLGEPIIIDGLKGITFGNGFSLGEANQLYFSAGPNGGTDGLFGKVAVVPEVGSLWLTTIVLSLSPILRRKRFASPVGCSQCS
jgi:uncharacterized protein (TIGR03118 family)